MNKLEQHIKNEFQIDRIVFFSDAVFAIAITLLISGIKVPEVKGIEVTEHNFLGELSSLLPKFLGFVTSFFIIGLY